MSAEVDSVAAKRSFSAVALHPTAGTHLFAVYEVTENNSSREEPR